MDVILIIGIVIAFFNFVIGIINVRCYIKSKDIWNLRIGLLNLLGSGVVFGILFNLVLPII